MWRRRTNRLRRCPCCVVSSCPVSVCLLLLMLCRAVGCAVLTMLTTNTRLTKISITFVMSMLNRKFQHCRGDMTFFFKLHEHTKVRRSPCKETEHFGRRMLFSPDLCEAEVSTQSTDSLGQPGNQLESVRRELRNMKIGQHKSTDDMHDVFQG